MALWLGSFWLLIWITTDVMPLPAAWQMTLSAPVLGYFVLNHLIGILTFMTIFGGLSSIYDNVQDANAVVIPCVMLVLAPFYATFTLLGNPANSLAETLSIFPFTSLYVMPARIALIDVPAADVMIALAVNIAVLLTLLIVTGKIYQVGVMTTGRKPTLREVLNWLKAS
jgi:ABC-2 type transport system permease protein